MRSIVFIWLAVISLSCSSKMEQPAASAEPPIVDVCTFLGTDEDDCFHIRFSCGDFGKADASNLRGEDLRDWKSLLADLGNGWEANPPLVGNRFEIMYRWEEDTICGGQVGKRQVILGFRLAGGQREGLGRLEKQATARFLGFSEDGTRAAFSAVSIREDEQPTASVYVLDVDKNDFAAPRITEGLTEDDADGEQSLESVLHAKVLQSAKPTLESQGIQPSRTGTIYQGFTLRPAKLSYNGDTLEVKLVQKDDAEHNQMFDLVVGSRVLQSDAKTPASRGQVKGYRLHSFYVLEDHIAVLIEYDRVSQSGTIPNHLMVTGSLKGLQP